MSRFGSSILVVMIAGACATPVQYIHYDAQQNLITTKPRYATTGDSLLLVIHDSLYRYRYVSKSDTASVIVGDRAPIFSAPEIGKLADAFPAQIFSPHVETKLDQESSASFDALLPSPDATVSIRSYVFGEKLPRGDKKQRLESLRAARDAAIRAECRAPIAAASNYFGSHPDQSAFLGFLADTRARDQANALAKGGDAAAIRDLADTLALRSLTQLELDSLAVRGTRFGRRISAFSMYLPTDLAGFKPSPATLDSVLTTLHGCVEARNFRQRVIASTQKEIEKLLADLKLPLETSDKPHPLSIGGILIDPFVEHTNDDALNALYNDLATITRTTALIASAVNTAPSYGTRYCLLPGAGTYTPGVVTVCTSAKREATADTIYIGTYWKPIQVRVTPVRGDRFAKAASPPTVTFAEAGSPAPPAQKPAAKKSAQAPKSRGEKSAGGKPADKSDQESPAAGAKEGASTGDKEDEGDDGDAKQKDVQTPSKPDTAPEPTIPTATIDVVERYRFHIGFGYAHSNLDAHTYDAKPDTVNGDAGTRVLVTGDARSQNFPLATLSYVILPWRGKVFARQAYAPPFVNYFKQLGLSAQFGLSLQHPTEQIFSGLSTEIVPGVELAGGKHFSYTESSKYAHNTFVATTTDPTPVRKQWKHSGHVFDAFAVTVDGNAIISAFGKLLALKGS